MEHFLLETQQVCDNVLRSIIGNEMHFTIDPIQREINYIPISPLIASSALCLCNTHPIRDPCPRNDCRYEIALSRILKLNVVFKIVFMILYLECSTSLPPFLLSRDPSGPSPSQCQHDMKVHYLEL